MSGLGDYGAALLLPQSVAGPRYLALLTAPIAGDEQGSALPEPTFAGYSRTEILPLNWTPVTSGCISNADPVALPVPSLGQAQIIQCALLDDPVAGNIWWVLDAVAFVLDAADPTPELAVGALSIGLPRMGAS